MTLAAIYKSLTVTYAKEFRDDQCNSFTRALSGFDPTLVDAAVAEWQGIVTPDWSGRALGATMPLPADIKAICMRLQTQSAAKASGEFVACRQCREGWIETRNQQGEFAVKPDRCACFEAWKSARQSTASPSTPRRRVRPASDWKSAAACQSAQA